MNLRQTVLIALFLMMGLTSFAQDAQQPPAEEKKIKIENKQLTGAINALSASFIAIAGGMSEDGSAAVEYAFNLDKNVRLIHRKTLKEYGIGDTVTVSYQLTTEKTAEGKELKNKKVTAITFVSPAPKGLISEERSANPQAGGAAPLSLKGLKER